MGLEVITRLTSLSEAEIVAGALRACGIRADVFDSGYGQMNWSVQLALGGFRVVAPEEQADEALAILNDIRASRVAGHERPDREPPVLPIWRRCAAAALILLIA